MNLCTGDLTNVNLERLLFEPRMLLEFLLSFCSSFESKMSEMPLNILVNFRSWPSSGPNYNFICGPEAQLAS